MTPYPEAPSLRVLLVEDCEEDGQLVVRELERGGFTVAAHRVEAAGALVAALTHAEWDLVISDHHLPAFNAPAALRLVREHASALPFIIVSGTIGEDLAVTAMKAGAADYLVKDHLKRLVPAVRRELADAEQRRQRAAAEASLKRTEDQLRQAQKLEAVAVLAGGIAHDFNNLLTVILGYSESLLASLPADACCRADIDEIWKAGNRGAVLARQLLTFSRKHPNDVAVLDFNAIVGNVEKLICRVLGPDVALVTDLDPGAGLVAVDVGQMEQVLMNLACNARDAMPTGGRLVIRTRLRELTEADQQRHAAITPGPYLCVTVADSGTGMTPEIVKQIFEPFFTTKDAGHGTGLGLSTVFGIVEQCGGCIDVHTAPGRGTAFDIWLPSVAASMPKDAAS